MNRRDYKFKNHLLFIVLKFQSFINYVLLANYSQYK